MTRILTGHANLTNGDATVTVTDLVLTDANCPADGSITIDGLQYFVLSRTDTTHLELTRNYTGTTGTGKIVEIDPLNANAISLVGVANSISTYQARLQLIDARGFGMFYENLGFTGAGDPGPGNVARDNATWSAVTELYIDVLDAVGTDQHAVIEGLWKQGTAVTVSSIETGAYATFRMTVAPTDMSGAWVKLTALVFVSSDGIITDGEDIRLAWVTDGVGLEIDHVGTFAGRATYDAQAAGYTYLSTDGDGGALTMAVLFFKNTVTTADWSDPIQFQGPKGYSGWGPELAVVVDGARTVLQLTSWVGGSGPTPTNDVGKYLGATGWESLIANGVDIRGATGRGFTPRGTYSGATAYVVDDLVLDNGSQWRNISASTGHAPPILPTASNTWWTLFAAKGTDGAGTGDVVGPAGATSGNLPSFNTGTGKLIQDSGIAASNVATKGLAVAMALIFGG